METIFGSVIAACVAGIGVLAGWVKTAFDKRDVARGEERAAAEKERLSSQARHDKCEEDKDLLMERIHRVEMKQIFFDGCPANPCPARAGLKLSESFSLNKNPPP